MAYLLSEATKKKYKRRRITITKRPKKAMSAKRSVINSGTLSPFGQRFTGKFRYTDIITINSLGITCGAYAFRVSSMYDCDFSGGGHQALFRDVLSGIYARYLVNSVGYKFTPLSPNTHNYLWGILATQDTSYAAQANSFSVNIEKRNTVHTRCMVNTVQPSITGRIQNHKVFAVTKKAYEAERSYAGAVGSDPSVDAYLTIFFQEMFGTAQSLSFLVEFEFETTYYEPKVQPQN